MTGLYPKSRRRRALCAAVLALPLLFGVGPAAADQFFPARGGWQTYVNDRFGMTFEYPADVFSPAEPPANGDGRTFTNADATLQIFAFHNTEQDTAGSLRRSLLGREGYENVTYSPSGQTWLVISGYRGANIFYEKYFFRGGVISAFGMEFPTDRKPAYAPIIERIEDSFRAGRSD